MTDRVVTVSGVTGFIGRVLTRRLLADGFTVIGAVRKRPTRAPEYLPVEVGSIDGKTDWRGALSGAGTVIHLAARTHVLRERKGGRIEDYWELNVEGTRRLVESAAGAGVRRFILVSSIKVNGEATLDQPFHACDPPAPQDAYGRSKWEAEKVLFSIATAARMEAVVVRPPLVHGPGVAGNLRRLLQAIRRGIPLPLASIDNRRSLVGVDNLADLLATCVTHPAAAGRIVLASDGKDLSTPELVRGLGRALGRDPWLVPFPTLGLRMGGALFGRTAGVRRLIGSLQVDISETRSVLDWSPPVTVDEGLRRAVVGG